MTILDLTESERETIFRACALIESVLEAYDEINLDTVLLDKEHRSIVNLRYSNNRKIGHERGIQQV